MEEEVNEKERGGIEGGKKEGGREEGLIVCLFFFVLGKNVISRNNLHTR